MIVLGVFASPAGGLRRQRTLTTAYCETRNVWRKPDEIKYDMSFLTTIVGNTKRRNFKIVGRINNSMSFGAITKRIKQTTKQYKSHASTGINARASI
jgi:hypothetical protein